MKKIFTLLIGLGLLTVADAQRGNRTSRARVGVNVSVNNNNGIHHNRFAADRMLREQIARINMKYDHEIQHQRNNYFMNRGQKKKNIRRLEQQRQYEIRRAQQHFYQNGNRYGSRYGNQYDNQYGSRNNHRY